MSWFRYVSKFVFRRWEGKLDPDKASQFMYVARITYFFSASTLLIYVYDKNKEYADLKEKEKLAKQEAAKKHPFDELSIEVPEESTGTAKKIEEQTRVDTNK